MKDQGTETLRRPDARKAARTYEVAIQDQVRAPANPIKCSSSIIVKWLEILDGFEASDRHIG